MEKSLDLDKIFQISAPKYFKKGESICNEGDPGEEMYIVLQGTAGVYISSVAQENLLIATIGPGEFFGEMALFQRQVRSATCIAEEDTTCIAINQEHLREFIVSCPEITEKLIAGLSGRVRKLDEIAYKGSAECKITSDIKFEIPAMHADSTYQDKTHQRYLRKVKMRCPVCKTAFSAHNIQIGQELFYKVLPNQRKVYEEAEPLWHIIRCCSQCGYSNYYTDFLKLPNVEPKILEDVLREEEKGIPAAWNSPFAKLIGAYYRAIHFNQCFNIDNTLLLANLWLYLGWIYEDAGQKYMNTYCHEKALEYYIETYEDKQNLFYNEYALNQCAMVVAELYYEKEEFGHAKEFYHRLTGCSNKRLSQHATERIYEIREKRQKGKRYSRE